MIPWLFQALSAKFSGAALRAIMAAALLFASGLLFYLGAARLERINARTERLATERIDALWRAETERHNAEVSRRAIARERAAAEASARLETEIAILRQTITELEAQNAALPNAARHSLSRARVRLLRRQAGGAAAAP